MNNSSNINETKGAAIIPDGSPEVSVLTLEDYLYGCVNVDVPREAIVRICLDREVDMHEEAYNIEKSVRDLCKADLLVWMVLGVSRRGSVSDTDNGWTHSDGGYTFTEADKKYFLKIADAIYEENDEATVGKIKAKIISSGIMPANYRLDGMPMPHIIQ